MFIEVDVIVDWEMGEIKAVKPMYLRYDMIESVSETKSPTPCTEIELSSRKTYLVQNSVEDVFAQIDSFLADG